MRGLLQFPLEVEDDWPPVGSESLPFEKLADGYRAMSPPLFVRDLSVGDVIDVSEDEFGFVSAWRHLAKSGRSVLWLLRLSETDEIDRVPIRLVSAPALPDYRPGSPGAKR